MATLRLSPPLVPALADPAGRRARSGAAIRPVWMAPRLAPPRASSPFWAGLAAALAFLGLRGVAAAAYRRALRRAPDDGETHFRLGETLAALGRWDEAAHAWRRAARLAPGRPEAHGNLALALARAGREEAAIAALRSLAALRPRQAEPHALLGAWLLRRRRPAEALHAFRDALAAHTAPPGVRFLLGETLLGAVAWHSLAAELHRARAVASPTPGAARGDSRPAAARSAGAWRSRLNAAPARVATPRGARARGHAGRASACWRATRAAGTTLIGACASVLRAPARALRFAAGLLIAYALMQVGRHCSRGGRAPLAIRCFRWAQTVAPRAAPATPPRRGRGTDQGGRCDWKPPCARRPSAR